MGVVEICPYCKAQNSLQKQELVGYIKNLVGDKIALYERLKRPKCHNCGNVLDMKRSPPEKVFV